MAATRAQSPKLIDFILIAMIVIALIFALSSCAPTKNLPQQKQIAIIEYKQKLQVQLCAGQLNKQEYDDLIAAYSELNSIK